MPSLISVTVFTTALTKPGFCPERDHQKKVHSQPAAMAAHPAAQAAARTSIV